ncbi:glucans biosynthesis glucosyltransferase MdoH [Tabrizicola fusiformis]|uniref:glucans biosynthesis glucosyltransferase MdoH n=1 Tax=Tabrizicola sp. SY72 TaxID=2741673 RepID=UPI001572457D|nr:glucans biosynthesis glucosyltransferase MdoH [Tabrizicola sp. SY72]NTT85930.1 glucans biosynthesis glucosyltransferase MdoH [Tabrizicola sp. SY72]
MPAPPSGGTQPEVRVLLTRTVTLALSLAAAWGGFLLFLQFGAADGMDAMDIVRSALIFASTFWLAWGAVQALAGLTTRPPAVPRDTGSLRGVTAILVPVYNEDPVATFARIAAMDASLKAAGQAAQFHFAILSDTRDEAIAARERHWFLRLLEETGGEGRIFYRRRLSNKGRKAGNIEDFIKRSGAAYEFSVILDADSLIEGETLVEMVRRMQAAPGLGLLQTLPVIIRAQSRFGRAMQFAGTFYSPIFARGLAMMQGHTGPFWGHNAIVRTRAFAESCGMPELAGKPPFGGHILSHDYVEAALLARAGWQVRVDDDIAGSYEEAPGNIVDHAKRDRRWCQGNLQHSRLLAAPGLKPWSRFVFLQGILAYIAPVFWLGFILASIAAPLFAPPPDYFPVEFWPFPVLPVSQASKALGLAVGVFGLLFVPKLLILLDAALRGRVAGFGGGLRALASVLAELVFSSLIAPIFLMYQTRSVSQVLRGADGGWPAQTRGDGSLSLSDAWAASHWIVTTGALTIAATQWLSPVLVPWLLPVTLPMLAAPLIIAWSSRASRPGVFLTPTEWQPAPVMALQDLILSRWQGMETPVQDRDMPGPAVTHA